MHRSEHFTHHLSFRSWGNHGRGLRGGSIQLSSWAMCFGILHHARFIVRVDRVRGSIRF